MTNDVNFGLWYDFRNPQPWQQPFETFYAERLAQIHRAEGMGFDSCWLTEHHFCDDGYTPSPLVLAGTIGARTSTMQLGTNLMLLPLHDPIRIAEDAATLSLVTAGRFDLGVGIGYRQLEFDQFGRKLSHRPSLVEEGIEILRRSWSGEPVNFPANASRWATCGSLLFPNTARRSCWAAWRPPPLSAPRVSPMAFCAPEASA